MTRKKSVLFICTRNQARSQMAEALLRHKASDRFEAFSAGSNPEKTVHPLTIAALADRGIDISGSRPKGFADLSGRKFDYVITLCDSARDSCPLFPGHPVSEHWSLEDPSLLTGTEKEKLEGFKRICDEISKRIDEFISRAG